MVVVAAEDVKEEGEEDEPSFSLISTLPYPSSFSQMSSSKLELEAENEAENIVKNLFGMREIRKKLKDPTNSLSDD